MYTIWSVYEIIPLFRGERDGHKTRRGLWLELSVIITEPLTQVSTESHVLLGSWYCATVRPSWGAECSSQVPSTSQFDHSRSIPHNVESKYSRLGLGIAQYHTPIRSRPLSQISIISSAPTALGQVSVTSERVPSASCPIEVIRISVLLVVMLGYPRDRYTPAYISSNIMHTLHACMADSGY